MRNRLGIGLIALVLLLAMPVLAQNNTGIISGRVTDQSGAVVPNAQITVTQTDTNVEAASATNSDGLYRVPSLRDGPYRVTVTAAGFKKAVRDGLTLRIGENLNVEMTLEVGAVSEAVEVTASQNEALPVLIYDLDVSYGPFIAFVPQSSAKPPHWPKTGPPYGQ